MGAYDCDCINNLEYDRRERKAQLSKEGATSDLISRTETVERLRGVIDVTVPITDYDGGYVDGVEVGISMVSTMPTIQPVATDTNVGDTISRQAALDAVEKNACNTQRIMDAVNNLPPVQPEPQWIPVGERLPEDMSEVNVTWVNHNPEPYYEFTKDKPFTATAVYYKGEWYWYSATCVDYLGEYGRCDWNKIDEAIEIIAWMPLPEAYKPNK